MPIMQWLYFDALECLPEDKEALTEDKCHPVCVYGPWGGAHGEDIIGGISGEAPSDLALVPSCSSAPEPLRWAGGRVWLRPAREVGQAEVLSSE